MSRYVDLTRRLLASGDATPEDGQGALLFYELENNLVSKQWTGEEFGDTTFVASEVRDKTPATCLIWPGQQLVFCISESNILKCYSYNPQEEQWVEANLGKAGNTTVHPESNLSASITPDGIIVIYQAPDNTLNGICNKGASWEPLEQIPAKPLPATPILTTILDSKLAVFYMHQDLCLHYQVKETGTSKWTDNTFQNSKFESPVGQIRVMENEKTNELAAYILTNNQIFQVNKSGERTDVGRIEEEEFVPTKSAEAVLVGWRYVQVPIWQDWYPVTTWQPYTWSGW